MAYEYSDLVSRAQAWAEQALTAQRLERDQLQSILNIDSRTPDNLFAEAGARPLIVAFMGGTGVGKSSLLNRLAGQNIAKTGIERPTSREVTLYHHQSVSISQLPAGLPIEKTHVSRHQDDDKKNIIWVDMPDFDSVEISNKHMVLEWLPHIDVLLYVVSPERYRDNKAWQLLLAEGANHAWLFVLNQWDRGQPSQYDDFRRQLTLAGFEDPMIFRTICVEESDDEFAELVKQLEVLSTGHTVEELEQRGREVRFRQLRQRLDSFQGWFERQNFLQLEEYQQEQWQKTENLLTEAFSWPLQQLSVAYAEKAGSKPDIDLWDEWAQNRFDDMLDELVLQASQLRIAVKPLKKAFMSTRDSAAKIVETQTQLACRQSLIKPGNVFQRFFLKLMRFCEFALPLSAMGIVGYQVFNGFYRSAMTGDAYLGTDFAVHGILLISLSWLIPYFLHKKLQPSLEKAALKGLNKGLEAALVQLDGQIKQVIQQERQQNIGLKKQLDEMIEICTQESKNTGLSRGSALDRILLD